MVITHNFMAPGFFVTIKSIESIIFIYKVLIAACVENKKKLCRAKKLVRQFLEKHF